MSDSITSAIINELRALRAAIDRNSDDIEALTGHKRLSRADRELLAVLFAAAEPVFGGKAFSAADVLAYPALASVADGHTASSLSWLFRRASAAAIAGFRLERLGRDRRGVFWRLKRQVITSASTDARDCGLLPSMDDEKDNHQ